MRTTREPLDWFIEACGVCGCQLGPGIGSRTPTGRCVDREHWQTGGVVVRVQARPVELQTLDASTKRLLLNHPELAS